MGAWSQIGPPPYKFGHRAAPTSVNRSEVSPPLSLRRTIPFVKRRRPTGPGLAKASSPRLLQQRKVELWHSADYRLRELFETADVMSEGATRRESEGSVYYGSTSVLLKVFDRSADAGRRDELTRLIGADPHARLRAVRIACLEAQLRADGPIGRVQAELFVRRDRKGVRIDVEVEARVFAEQLGRVTLGGSRTSAKVGRAGRSPRQ